MLFNDIASMFRDAVLGWNRFWFEPQSGKALAYTRVAVGGVALLYVLSWFPDLVSWIGPSGPLSPTSSASLMDRTGDMSILGSIAAFRPSLLYGIQSSTGIYCYLIVTAISAALLMLGIGGRWIAVSTLILVLGIVHRCVGITGIAEPLLTTFLAYLVVSTGRSASLKPGLDDPSSNGLLSNIALRLMQVHMAAWLIVSFFSQQASLIWWQGEGMWYFAASKKSLLLNSNSLLQSDWLTNGLTHFFILLQFIAIPALFVGKTRAFGFVLLSLFWILIAVLAGEISYALVGMACSLPFFPQGLARRAS